MSSCALYDSWWGKKILNVNTKLFFVLCGKHSLLMLKTDFGRTKPDFVSSHDFWTDTVNAFVFLKILTPYCHA